MLELHQKRGKYWKPQLDLTPAGKAVPFGPFALRTFGGTLMEFPGAGSTTHGPVFVTLIFRDAFHDMNLAWAWHVFAHTTRWPRVDAMLPPSVARQLGRTVDPALPPAPLFQVLVRLSICLNVCPPLGHVSMECRATCACLVFMLAIP
jgi:hypothetical protein